MHNESPPTDETENSHEKTEGGKIEINFGINDDILIILAIHRSDCPYVDDPDIKAIGERIRSTSPEMLDFLNNKYTYDEPIPQRYQQYLDQIKTSPEYQRIRSATEQYAAECRNQWIRNYQQSYEIIKDLTGLNLDRRFSVRIHHPLLRIGYNSGNNGIHWGHHDDWPNYTTVYLWHEILHSYFGYSDIDHAIIELITDNELRVRLNGGTYGQARYEGHHGLSPLKDSILSSWQDYINSPTENRNIYDFVEKMKQLCSQK